MSGEKGGEGNQTGERMGAPTAIEMRSASKAVIGNPRAGPGDIKRMGIPVTRRWGVRLSDLRNFG